ncbi:transposase [Streptomyces sp. NPDC059215]|uniref:transposase n=1 Tax=Streptomyces sp. NPDC059215 TaxID=3346772 RepID=UPI0036CFF82E
MCGWFPCAGENGGADTGPSPVDRRKASSKHHLICDGSGTPFKVITTEANVNDVTRTLALVDGIPPVAGRPGRPRRRPDALLGDKATTPRPTMTNCGNGGSCLSSHARDHRTSRVWASFATSWNRLSPCSIVQTSRRPLGTPNRTPRSLRFPGLQRHLLETAQEGLLLIAPQMISASPAS